MRSIKHLHRRLLTTRTAAGLGAVTAAGALALSLGLGAASAASAGNGAAARSSGPFSFALVPSPGIAKCLPNAGGEVTITPGNLNDIMQVSLHGMPRDTGFDLFVIQQPLKPFGVAWYQSDINVGDNGSGSARVRGIFDRETFSVSLGGTTTFPPTHQFHLGVWFNNPNTPFNLGCEPKGTTKPIVTPFNGEQHAGIQVVNTSEFPDNAGPLSHVHR
jgi:hypothetical protein